MAERRPEESREEGEDRAPIPRAQERFAFALEAAGVAAWDWDPATDELAQSPGAARILGLPPGRTLRAGAEFLELVHPEDRERVRRAAYRAFEQAGEYEEEFRVPRGSGTHGDGSPAWVIARGRAFCGDSGAAVRLSGVLIDVTERRQVQEQVRALDERLRRSAEELQAILDVLPVGIFIADDPACTSIRTNPAGAEMLGISAESNASKTGPEGTRLPFRVLRDGVEVPPEELSMQRAARTGQVVLAEEYDIVWDDGTWRRLLEYATPLFEGGLLEGGLLEGGVAGRGGERKVRGCVGTFVDITERRQAEAALREADRRKDEFLALLAHELRNPLAPIRYAIELLRRKAPPDPALQAAQAVIDRQIHHLSRLVDDLLDVSRITRGKLVLRRERASLADVVERALETARPHIETARHRLRVQLPPEPLHLEVDPVRMAQALSNLLQNAAKYTPPGGQIALVVAREGDQVRLRVRDSGVGIPPEMISRIFEIFTQVDASLERAQGGLGIGLTLVKRLVEMHGGHVAVASEGAGRGSEFTVTLPLSRPETAASEERTADAEQRPRRILVVDDNRDAADSLAMLLEAEGHEVRAVYNGADALAAAAAAEPEVVLLDIGMPGMSGYDVARALRARGVGALVIAMTGWGQEEDRRRSREAGFDHHLVKPPDLDVLGRLLAVPDKTQR